MNRSLLAPFSFQNQFVRTFFLRQQPNKKHIYRRQGNAKSYDDVIYYKPEKFEEPKDLPEPSKLFRVQRISGLKHRNYWEKKIINDLGLLYSINSVAVVKNTPEMCALLWRVKHLISVEPITFPYGEPTEDDINYTNLKENGECIVHKKLEIPAERIEATEKFINDPVRLDKDTLKRDALLKWNSGR